MEFYSSCSWISQTKMAYLRTWSHSFYSPLNYSRPLTKLKTILYHIPYLLRRRKCLVDIVKILPIRLD